MIKNNLDIKYTLIILLFLLVLPLISARVQFYQHKSINPTIQGVKINGTIQDFIFLQYDADLDDFISTNVYEPYVWYTMYIKKWNQMNPSYIIEWCNFTVLQRLNKESNLSIVYNQLFTNESFDIENGKYFLRMIDGDTAHFRFMCKYQNESQVLMNVDTPETMQIITTTNECKSCQFYEWTIQQRAINKALTISDYRIKTTSRIYDLISINLQNVLAGFWFMLIVILIAGVSLIMLGLYWSFLFLEKLTK
jgi:hypothetical protein